MTFPIEWVACALGGLVVGYIIGAIFTNSRKSNDLGSELRQELDKLKQNDDVRAGHLRGEIVTLLLGFQDNTLKSFKELSGGLDTQVKDFGARLDGGIKSMSEGISSLTGETQNKLETAAQKQATSSKEAREELANTLHRFGENINQSIANLSDKQEKAQVALKDAVEKRLDVLRTENVAKLEEMRATVDEKLQGTLEKRLGESFKQVSGLLEQVFKSLGEMQSLATGVGDLNKILTNVKARGSLGESFLNDLLQEMLAPNQFAANVEIEPNSGKRVEFAIKLPRGHEDNDQPLWLPIDSKWPHEDYRRLVDASERGDADAIESAIKSIEGFVWASAKDIHEKYIRPPHSTDFGILFLPTEGLFAEVIRRNGLVNSLQREYNVSVAGPTTLMALLKSLSMGFRTLAIQKRSSEVWRVLGAIKTEFGEYGRLMDKVQKKLVEAQNVVSDVGVRQRAINRKLRDVEVLPELEAATLLKIDVLQEDTDEVDEPSENANKVA